MEISEVNFRKKIYFWYQQVITKGSLVQFITNSIIHQIILQPLHNKWTRTLLRTAVDYPCLCLCFGFSQITLIRPFRLMILHFSQIGFTDDLTFMLNPPFKKDRFILYHGIYTNAISFFEELLCNSTYLSK